VVGNITTLGSTLRDGLDGFRADNKASAEALRQAIQQNLEAQSQRLSGFISESNRQQIEAQNTLHSKLNELSAGNATQQEKLRATVEGRLDQLNATNAGKLEEMRLTVDEKLHATLHSRLTESFGQVTDQLNKVHTGLGEMSKLSENVDGLSRVFTNVRTRGGIGEVILGTLLRQMLAPSQFIENAQVKANSGERVEYAVRFPSSAGERLMPIDSKFPKEDWERLDAAYKSNDTDAIERCGRAFENAIRIQAKTICAKYIHPPATTPYAVMFLPSEALYAEVLQRETLQEEIQSKCHVTIAGPTTLSAILTSFQMGFHMLALQEKGDEVWKVLESAKKEFGNFEKLMDKIEGDVGKIQKSLGDVGVRTRAINRTLREVGDAGPTGELDFGEVPPAPLRLVANAED
jgi:DNA recombination protein RmuC